MAEKEIDVLDVTSPAEALKQYAEDYVITLDKTTSGPLMLIACELQIANRHRKRLH